MPKRNDTDTPTDTLEFPKTCHRWLRQLATHNDRDWFAAHRQEYHEHVLEPARAFVVAAGERLRRFAPTVIADPRADGTGSISRIQRDLRFAANREPYRPFVGMLFWLGDPVRKWDSPGFHLVLQPGVVRLSAGIRQFTPAQLVQWRAACGAADLRKLLKKLGGFERNEAHYKRVPKGYEPDGALHDELLRCRGLTVTEERKVKVAFCGAEFLDACVKTWKKMAGLNEWLAELG